VGLMVLVQNADLPLRHSNGLLRAIFDASRDGILVSSQQEILYVNRALVSQFGYGSSGELLGRPISALLPQQEHARLEEMHTQLLRGKAAPRTFAFAGLRKDGRRVDLEAAVSLAEIGGQRLLVSMVRDVSERRAAQQQVAEINQMLEAVLHASPLAIISLDLESRVRVWNPAAERIFGWKAEEVLGQPIPVIPEKEGAQFEFLRHTVLEGNKIIGVEVRRNTREGKVLDLSLSAGPMRNAAGAVTGTMAVLEDITRRKQLERQLEQSRKMEVLGRLAAGVAHDFNNLLTAVLLYSGLMGHQVARGSRLRKNLGEIRKAAERGAALVNQLLAYTRQQTAQPQVLNLNAVIAGIAGMLQRLVGEDIKLETICAADLGNVIADPAQMEQVILNLAANARDAMPGGGRLLLETANQGIASTPAGRVGKRGAWVVLTVADGGAGMDAEMKAKAFEPFYTTKERGKGTGLGLASVQSLVQQAGGEIEVESEPGKGTTVRVSLPRVDDQEPQGRAPASPVVAGGSAQETLLLVEDDEAVRGSLAQTLERTGYRVLQARHGAEALRVLQAFDGSIDLMITDLIMPGMSGRDLAQRATRLRPGLRVLYVSGYSDEARLEQLAGQPFIPKPFEETGLHRKLRELLDA